MFFLQVTTTIGYGSPNKANSYAVHGAALGGKEVDATRQNLGWPYDPFFVPEDVKRYISTSTLLSKQSYIEFILNGIWFSSHWSQHIPDGAALEAEWTAKFSDYEKKYSEDAAELKQIISGEFPAGWENALPVRNL